MTINDLFGLGNKYRQEGNMQMALQLWADCIKNDPFFGPAHINLADAMRQQGNVAAERNHLNLFLDCPLTGRTLSLVQQATTRLQEIEKMAQPPK